MVRAWRVLVVMTLVVLGLILSRSGAAAQAKPTLQVASELTTKNVRTEESNLAGLVADAIRAVQKSDIALIPAIGFTETTVPKGPATTEDILKALEYRNDMVVIVKLSGEQVRRALEHGLALLPQKNPAFLQVSGLTVTVDPAADRTKRVVSAKVGKNALQDGKTYEVAMPSPLANGALAYFKIWSKADISKETSRTVEEAVTNYLATQKTIGQKGEERIAFRK